jgi:hypothetical protein
MKKIFSRIVISASLTGAFLLAPGLSFAGATSTFSDCFTLTKRLLSKAEITQVYKGKEFQRYKEIIAGELARDLPKRPRGIKELRKVINEEGLFTVIERNRPLSEKAVAIDELRTGTKVVYKNDVLGDPAEARGVFLHPVAPDLMKKIRGRVNAQEGRGDFNKIFDHKGAEYVFAETLVPGSMSKTVFGSDLINIKGKKVSKLTQSLNFLDRIENASSEDVSTLEELLHDFFRISKAEMKGPAQIKHVKEFQTGDRDEIVTTASDPDTLILPFIDFLKNLPHKIKTLPLAHPKIQKVITNKGDRATKIINSLLVHPEDLLVQRQLDLKKTFSGTPLEFRVDYLDGEPLAVSGRHGWDYNSAEDKMAAMKFVSDFFKNAPTPFKHLSGGADVAFTKDGKIKFIEFNIGCESGFLEPEVSPVHLQTYISNLTGKLTPKLTELIDVLDQPWNSQKKFFQNLSRDPLLKEKPEEVLRWFCDQSIDRWKNHPTLSSKNKLLAEIEELSETMPGEKDVLHDILLDARHYLQEWNQ